MRRIEKLIGETVSSVIILIVGVMIVSELVKTSSIVQWFVPVMVVVFVLLIIAVGIKIYDYLR